MMNIDGRGDDELEEEAAALLSIAERIETGNGGYPALIRAAAKLANGHEGSERERAIHVSRTVIRPLAGEMVAASTETEADGEALESIEKKR